MPTEVAVGYAEHVARICASIAIRCDRQPTLKPRKRTLWHLQLKQPDTCGALRVPHCWKQTRDTLEGERGGLGEIGATASVKLDVLLGGPDVQSQVEWVVVEPAFGQREGALDERNVIHVIRGQPKRRQQVDRPHTV